jgi:hypothetical protein
MARAIPSALAVLLMTGCTAARMAVPADVAQASQELAITDRSSWSGALADESFGMGPYKITEVDRKWNSTHSGSIFGSESSKTGGGYAFKFVDGGTTLVGTCATEDREKSANLGGGWEFSAMVAKLGCTCSDANGSANVVLQASTTDTYEGTLTSANTEYHVLAINERDGGGSSHNPTGYRVDGKDAPAGAVDVMGKGRVWLSKTVEGRARADLSCLFAGLLLYQPPKDR